MTRTFQNLATLLAVLSAAGCHGGKQVGLNNLGSTSFTSQAPNGGSRGGALSAGAAQNGAGGSSGSSGASSASSAPRTIQESDLYAVAGNVLYVLNTYRGLQVVDVSNPSAPQLLAKVPIVGTPQGLYVEGNTAYVIVSDYFYYDYVADYGALGAAYLPWVGSQVWAVDVSTPSAPNVLSRLPVNGSIDDSRIIGNILYVVSNVWAYQYIYGPSVGGYGSTTTDLTFVASFDVTNPSVMKPVTELDFPANGWNIHDNFTQTRVVISESSWNSSSTGPVTQFQPIDISDPAGALTLGTMYTAKGTVDDRWAMDFDATTHLFRAVLNANWGNAGGALEIWNAPDVNTAQPVSTLNLNIQEAITAASFDGSRAYVSTAYCTDPLWIIDTSTPTTPVVAGSVQLQGAVDFLEPMGNQIVAMGHTSPGCVAWEGAGALAVTLFDVTDATKPAVLSQVSFGSAYTQVSASIDDMKKAFQVLGPLGLILVPFQSWDYTSYTYSGGTQLIDLGAKSLTLRGLAPQQGYVQRAFPVQDKIVAFSDRSLQVLDISNRDQPTPIGKLDLARPVLGLTVIGDQLVELSGDWTIGDTELAVTDAATPDQPVPNAVVQIPAPNAQTFQDGNIMWILANDYQSSSAWLQAVDVSTPSSPRLRGKVTVDPSIVPSWYGGWYAWGYGDEAQLVNHALLMHRSYYGCYDCGAGYTPAPDQIFVIDLSNPDAPSVGAPLTLPDSDWSWGLTAVGSFGWITHYEWVPSSNYGQVRYYVDRIDLTNPRSPQLLTKINVPGVFFAASADGQTLYTQDITYPQSTGYYGGQGTTWLNQLTLRGGSAQLDAAISLSGYPGSAAINGNTAYLETWTWGSSNSQAVLSAIDLSSLTVKSSQIVASNWAWIVKAAGGKLFLQADWYDSGLLIYDLTNPGLPLYQGSVRTEGWVQDVVVSGNTAYLPSGDYGTPMIDLTAGSKIPFLL